SCAGLANARLTLSGVGSEPQVFQLDAETIVGRSVKAAIQIDGDLVSRQHARFFQQGDRWYVEDLGSRNGTLLNGNRITTAPLTAGDVVMIGYGRLDFEEDRADSSTFEVSFVEDRAPLESVVLAAEEESESSGTTMTLTYKDLVQINHRMTQIVRVGQRI